jgi:hypothetical protein
VSKPASQGSQGQQLLPGEERRRSQRVVVRVPVTLQFTVAGQKVSVRATTVSLNDHGAMVSCARTLPLETKLELQNGRTMEKITCRVTRSPVECPEGYLIPIEFATRAPGFWRISFPPTDWKPLED